MINVGDIVAFKRFGNSPDMSKGEIIEINDADEYGYAIKSVRVRFITKRGTWDKETRQWLPKMFTRTIKNLKHMRVLHAS